MDKFIELVQHLVLSLGAESLKGSNMKLDFFYGLCAALDLAFETAEGYEAARSGEVFAWAHKQMVARHALHPTSKSAVAVEIAAFLIQQNYAARKDAQ